MRNIGTGSSVGRGAWRLIEVIAVLAAGVGGVALVARSPLAGWQYAVLGRPFAEYLALGLTGVLAMALTRSPLSSFGLACTNVRGQLDVAFACLVPYAVGKALTLGVPRSQALASIVEPLIVLGVVAVWTRVLRSRWPEASTPVMVLLLAWPQLALGKVASALVFYPLFLAPAEELLFRGFIQARLNLAFGRPWRLAGAAFGLGGILTACLFSLFHVANLPALVQGRLDLAWGMAIPTLAWGLALGYLRERTDSLVPSIIVHGVPQAIAWAVLGR